jgi:hypothetical protein
MDTSEALWLELFSSSAMIRGKQNEVNEAYWAKRHENFAKVKIEQRTQANSYVSVSGRQPVKTTTSKVLDRGGSL